MAYEIIELKEGFLQFVIKRHERRNAVNFEVMDGLQKAIDKVKKSHHLGLVITGEGDQAFCSGGDLSVFHELKTEEEAYDMLSRMANILFDLFMLPKPTIALLNGIAIGGGCEIATACDFRFAHFNTRAGFVQGNLAITTGWGGGTMLLERLPSSQALSMLMKAKIYDAPELKEMGFIDYMYEGSHLEGLRAGLETMPSIEIEVLQAYKEIVLRKRDPLRLKEQVIREVRQCSILWEKEAHHEKVNLFINRKNSNI
ncbi:enoyl-CoA hydratase/isomerase family protein [Robertmurraya korlensis]|uniref:enoyl-CoA hydratase/isomerase family protein n=1 Tax=Robertmurraya korlensis TaxID=519977 RepID=UPI00203ADE1C|nr:enoyl-CoA hydratase/isomerase family protein [Robertmurraya korlensis]MCM3600299.1 enoyl-CoA hydratase/isomerase family protein [Robertmurraya korlensis]